jgi:hypothetical protein
MHQIADVPRVASKYCLSRPFHKQTPCAYLLEKELHHLVHQHKTLDSDRSRISVAEHNIDIKNYLMQNQIYK